MKPSPPPDNRLVQYLLGRMPEKERVELEGRLFRDEHLDEELLVATDDLIRAYLAGELPEEDRAQFEAHFLASPANREQLALMRDVPTAMDRLSEEAVQAGESYLGVPAPPRSRGRTLAAAAAVALAVGLAVGMAARRLSRGDERTTATPPPAVPPMASAPTRPESPTPRVPPPAAVRVLRLPVKSGTQVDVRLSPSTRAVRVELAVDQRSLSFEATVLTVDGKAVWRADGLAPSAPGEPLIFEVPAEIFASGQYTLRVEGESLRRAAAAVLEYRLQVVRER
jgi:anti-sigma factor RsiW